ARCRPRRWNAGWPPRLPGPAPPGAERAVDRVPVLLYHSVAEDPPSWLAPWTVTPRVFTEQLDRIADHGLAVVPLRRLVAAQRGGAPLPSGAAILTFDDGYADFYWTAAPLLFRRELPVTLFVTTGAIH